MPAVRNDVRRLREALRAAQRQALAGRLVASISHDMGNNLTAIEMGLRGLRRRDPAHSASDVAKLLEAVMALKELNRNLSLLSGLAAPEASAPEAADLVEVTQRALHLVAGYGREQSCSIELHDRGASRLPLRRAAVCRAVVAMLLRALDQCGPVRVRVEVGGLESGAEVAVHDSGDTAVAALPDMQDPELALVHDCAAAHGGEVQVSTSPLGGACVRLILPGVPASIRTTPPASG